MEREKDVAETWERGRACMGSSIKNLDFQNQVEARNGFAAFSLFTSLPDSREGTKSSVPDVVPEDDHPEPRLLHCNIGIPDVLYICGRESVLDYCSMAGNYSSAKRQR